MAYRKKEDWLNEAARLGIDVDGLSWPQLQKTVSQALKREELGISTDTDGDKPVFDIAEQRPKPKKKRKRMMTMAELDEQRLRQFTGQEIMIAPEIYPSTKRAIHYKEDIGPEILVDEKHYDIRGLEFNTGRDVDSGTYVIKGKTGERVVATSAIPKEEPGLKINPGKDYVPRVTYMGREGYLWTHHSYPNIRELLEQSGYYEEYKHLFKDEPNIWYSAGLLVCEPSVVHNVFREIEEKERLKMERGY